MNRKEFLAGAGTLLGAALVPTTAHAASSNETAILEQIVSDYYSVFYARMDKARYRAMLADDYLLLEGGEVMDAAADIADMPSPESGFKRTDSFQFHSVKIQ